MPPPDSTCKDLMKNAAPIMFGMIIVLGFFYVVHTLLTHEYPPANKDPLFSLLETLKNILIMAIGWFFGSSASTKAKDETISAIATAAPIPSAPIAPLPSPINIPNAESVNVATKEGDVNVQPTQTPTGDKP